MKITKIYETSLDLSAIEQMSSKGIDSIVLDKLIILYENKCEKGTLITKILEILKRSDVVQSKDRKNGEGKINVQFKAEAIIYNDDLEILSPCKIEKIKNDFSMLCTYENICTIFIDSNRNLVETLVEGQSIPIMIKKSTYIKGQKQIAIRGFAYFQPSMFKTYEISQNDPPDESKIILIDEIKDKIKNLLKSIDVADLNKYQDIFWPKFLNEKIKKIEKIEKIENLQKYITMKKEFIIFKHPFSNGISDEICIIDSSKFDESWYNEYIGQYELENLHNIKNINDIIYELYFQYENTLEMVINMNNLLKNKKDFENYNRTWTAYKNYSFLD